MAFTNAQRQAGWRAARRAELLVLRKMLRQQACITPTRR